MTGFVFVIPAFLQKLAGIHESLVPQIQRATAMTDPTPRAVEKSHGTASSFSNYALADLHRVRSAVGEGMAGVASDLASKLHVSSEKYSSTDSGSANLIGQLLNN